MIQHIILFSIGLIRLDTPSNLFVHSVRSKLSVICFSSEKFYYQSCLQFNYKIYNHSTLSLFACLFISVGMFAQPKSNRQKEEEKAVAIIRTIQTHIFNNGGQTNSQTKFLMDSTYFVFSTKCYIFALRSKVNKNI